MENVEKKSTISSKNIKEMTPEEKKKKIIKSGILMLLDLIIILIFIWIALTRGWFVTGDSSNAPVDVEVQKVNYEVKDADNTKPGCDLFIPRFYLEESNDRFDNSDEEEDIPATGINKIVRYDDSTTVIANLTLEVEASLRVRAILIPANANEIVTWSSSNDEYASVTKYGRVRGLKPTGESGVTITATISQKDSNNQPITKSFTVVVVEAHGGNEDYNYVPANTNIIQDGKDISVINYSTVPTKLRMLIDISYEGIGSEEDETNNGRNDYTIESVFEKIKEKDSTKTSLFTESDNQGPLKVDVNEIDEKKQWTNLPIKKIFSFLDSNDYMWNVTKMFLNEAEYNGLSIDNVNTTSYMKQLETAFYYGTNDEEITDYNTGDYGSVIPAASSTNGDIIPVLSSVQLTDMYTSYSTLKGLKITITFQARQADYFVTNSSGDSEEDGWFDVYTCDFKPN